jgi:hypothetical protein
VLLNIEFKVDNCYDEWTYLVNSFDFSYIYCNGLSCVMPQPLALVVFSLLPPDLELLSYRCCKHLGYTKKIYSVLLV